MQAFPTGEDFSSFQVNSNSDKCAHTGGNGAGADDTMADFTLNLNSLASDCATSSTDNNSLDEVNLLRCVYLLQTGFEGGLQVNYFLGSKIITKITTNKYFSIC